MTILPDALDWDSYIECSDSEDQDDHESTYGGNAQSILSGLEESIGRIDDFLAFERRFLHGDIVRALEDPSEQMGQVINVDMIVDLEAVSGEIVKAVNTQNLIKLRSFSLGDYVVHGPWLGKVVKVVDLVTILFDDGAKYKMRTEDPEILVPICSDMLEDAQYPYYPGQRVRVRLSSVFEFGLWKGSQNEGIVCHVEVGSLCINWITSVMVGTDFSGPTPPSWQDPKDLTLLSCFSQVNWQLGDWCSFQFGDYKNYDLGKEKLILPNISGENLTTLYRGMHRRNPDFGQKFLLVKTKTKVDVLWQDGNYSVGLDSQTLTAVGHVGDHEFWPQQYVMEKGAYDNSIAADQRVGIVKSMNAKERTVRVEWAFSGVYGAVGSNAKFNEETVSAYELLEHPEFSYCMGDVVIRLIQNTKNSVKFHPVSQTDRENQSHKDSTTVKLDRVTSTTTRELIGDCQGYACDYLSCIGIVTGIKDGRVEVKWASGLISKVEPHDIVGIERHEDTASTPVSYEDDIDVHASEGMLAYKKQSSFLNKEKGVLEKAVIGSSKDHKSDLWDASALSLPRAALGFLTSVATSLFGSHGSSSITSTFFNRLSEKDELDIEDMPSSKDQSEILIKASLKQQEVETQEKEELACGTESEKLGPSFKQFDTVTDYLDHHFANGIGNESTLPDVRKGWLKRANQEWEILERNLPDTIYVRVYEERMDLMRAAIIGAPETPYHDGLFFFDIFVPPDYPSEPPIVHYKSGGLRLNPNLYESGRVCLSLLNTWTGIDSEMWNPDKSTVLQVLLSLQALVLNEKPYFNEAGYDQQVGRAEGEKNSTAYNENAFLLSCKSSMLYMLRNPPKHFEALVEEHFRSRSHSILLACQAYMDGAQVGCAFNSEKVAREDQKSSSTGFRIMLAKLFPLLVKAFGENGIDCHKFLEQIDEVPKLG